MTGSPEAALLRHGTKLPTIAGAAPDLSAKSAGCLFAPRCEDKMDECIEREPRIVTTEDAGTVACFKYGG